MIVENFTCSTMFETHRNGNKQQHFVSAGVKLDPGVSVEEFPLYQIQAAYKVSVAAVHDAVMRGSLSVEDGNERIEIYKNNYNAMKPKLERSLPSSTENQV
jgi:predicted DNA-binding protein YlxM (UPF0122 family)